MHHTITVNKCIGSGLAKGLMLRRNWQYWTVIPRIGEYMFDPFFCWKCSLPELYFLTQPRMCWKMNKYIYNIPKISQCVFFISALQAQWFRIPEPTQAGWGSFYGFPTCQCTGKNYFWLESFTAWKRLMKYSWMQGLQRWSTVFLFIFAVIPTYLILCPSYGNVKHSLQSVDIIINNIIIINVGHSVTQINKI